MEAGGDQSVTGERSETNDGHWDPGEMAACLGHAIVVGAKDSCGGPGKTPDGNDGSVDVYTGGRYESR